jgi:hypothetical protein
LKYVTDSRQIEPDPRAPPLKKNAVQRRLDLKRHLKKAYPGHSYVPTLQDWRILKCRAGDQHSLAVWCGHRPHLNRNAGVCGDGLTGPGVGWERGRKNRDEDSSTFHVRVQLVKVLVSLMLSHFIDEILEVDWRTRLSTSEEREHAHTVLDARLEA